jgi:hypothetical protein
MQYDDDASAQGSRRIDIEAVGTPPMPSMLGVNYRHRTPLVSGLSPRGIINDLRAEAERPTASWFNLNDVWSGPAEVGVGLSPNDRHILW